MALIHGIIADHIPPRVTASRVTTFDPDTDREAFRLLAERNLSLPATLKARAGQDVAPINLSPAIFHDPFIEHVMAEVRAVENDLGAEIHFRFALVQLDMHWDGDTGLQPWHLCSLFEWEGKTYLGPQLVSLGHPLMAYRGAVENDRFAPEEKDAVVATAVRAIPEAFREAGIDLAGMFMRLPPHTANADSRTGNLFQRLLNLKPLENLLDDQLYFQGVYFDRDTSHSTALHPEVPVTAILNRTCRAWAEALKLPVEIPNAIDPATSNARQAAYIDDLHRPLMAPGCFDDLTPPERVAALERLAVAATLSAEPMPTRTERWDETRPPALDAERLRRTGTDHALAVWRKELAWGDLEGWEARFSTQDALSKAWFAAMHPAEKPRYLNHFEWLEQRQTGGAAR